MSVEAKVGLEQPSRRSPRRKPRADGQRNRERLMEAAKAAFAEVGADVSLDEIARRAGVGIGTLYRHFPTRDAIVEAVYRREVQQLAEPATRLLDDAAARRGAARMDAAVRRLYRHQEGHRAGPGLDRRRRIGALRRLGRADHRRHVACWWTRAAPAGDIRADVDPTDLLRALVGFTYGAASPDWQASALRLIDILMDGLRPPNRAN